MLAANVSLCNTNWENRFIVFQKSLRAHQWHINLDVTKDTLLSRSHKLDEPVLDQLLKLN
ncbi:MAG: hypothetical protein EBT61_21310 [Verrucomicrobia bacterium]|nr:hypothetical protein [Verrucomicrobiota bacterium]